VARIRSIKPGFWSDGKVRRLSDTTALFFISLWNFADDAGYFQLDGLELSDKVCRWRSQDVMRMLSTLHRAGMVRLSARHGVGMVATWEHQKIDKPKLSKWKDIEIQWDEQINSSNVRRSFDARIGEDRIGEDRISTNQESVPDSSVKKKSKNPEQTEKRKAVRNAFLSAYERCFASAYPATFSGKEYRQIDSWLKSVSLEQALEYCRVWPEWNDPWVTERGHAFGLLITKYIELDAWMKRPGQMIEKIAIGRATKKAQLTDIQRLAEIKAYAAMDKEPNSKHLSGGSEGLPGSSQNGILEHSREGDRPTQDFSHEFEEDHASSF
jgi:hypothetical protein